MKKEKKCVKSISDVFDLVYEKMGCKNRKDLLRELDVSDGYLSKLQNGKKHLSEEKALKIASKAGLNDESMLVLLAREKAASDEARAVWDKIICGQCRIMNSAVPNARLTSPGCTHEQDAVKQ